MEYFGLFAFVMVLCYMGLPRQVRQLESKVKKLNKTVSNNIKGENVMSKLINDLVGKKCIVKSDAGLELISNNEIECKILEADEDWLKIEYAEKKGNVITMLLRIDDIERVEILNEENVTE
ncbi:MAG: hypothetical protein E7271_04710 [Lachnospiraceae bacterium]|jgi:hypothetical protein|nr:hypothetical protein [Lachnospiraceae bacterium]